MQTVSLHHEIDRQAQLAAADIHVGAAVSALDDFGIVGHDSDVVPAAHELAGVAGPAVGLGGEDFHHVLFGVGGGVRAAVAVGGHVERLVVVQEFEHVGWRGDVDDGGGDDLVHGLVVGGFGWVVDEPGAAAVDGAGEEGHADGFLVGDALEGADEVCAFEILCVRERESTKAGSGAATFPKTKCLRAYLGFVSPLVPQFVEDIDIAERIQDATHETRLSDGSLGMVKP